ncbi:MAG: caspase family protein [Nitrospinales bacterium]
MKKRHLKTSLILFLLILPYTVSNVFAARALKLVPEEGAAVSNKRTALIIGNSDYKTSPLKNPLNDAEDIAYELQRLGFKVQLGKNMNKKDMFFAIREFGKEIKQGGVGLFYYAGHGMQVHGKNFLIPVGADIHSEDEVEYEAIDAGLILRKMEAAGNPMNIVMLDACRDNPFARSFRSNQKGLAQMDAPSGSLIVYATAPGSVAADGGGRNGTFTKNFLGHVRDPDLEVGQMLKRVRAGVQKDTNGQQVPWESSSLVGDFYFVEKNAEVAASASRSSNNDLLDQERLKLEEEKRALAAEKSRFQDEQLNKEKAKLEAEKQKLAEDKRRFEDEQRQKEMAALATEKQRLAEEKRRLELEKQKLQVARAQPATQSRSFQNNQNQTAPRRFNSSARRLSGFQKFAPMQKNAKELLSLVQGDLNSNPNLAEPVKKEVMRVMSLLKGATMKGSFKSTHDNMGALKKLAVDNQLGPAGKYENFKVLTIDQSIEIARQQN